MNNQTSILLITSAVVVLFLSLLVSSQDDNNFVISESEPIFVDREKYSNQLARVLQGAKDYGRIVLQLPLFQKFIDAWLASVRTKYNQNTCLADLDYFDDSIRAQNKTSEASKVFYSVIEFEITSESIAECSFADDKFNPKCFMYLGIPPDYMVATPEKIDRRYIILTRCTRILYL